MRRLRGLGHALQHATAVRRRRRALAAATAVAVLVFVLALAALSTGPAGAATGCTASGPYSNAVSKTSGLVAYWRLGDTSGTTACDFRGISPGTYSAGATLNQAGALAGDSDTSAVFNGTTGNVSVPSSTTLNTGDTFTIEAWVKRGSTGGTQVIASKQGTAWALVFTTQNLPSLQANGKAITTSKTAVSDTTTWHHIVATKAGTAVHLYLDGADVTGTVSNSTVANSTSALTIGSAGSTSWFKGSLDEVAYYSAALSADQVTNHYLLGRTSCPANTPYSQGIAQTSGLIGYWRLGERSGTAACDTTGANPGTYTGGFTLGQSGAISGDSDASVLFNGTSGWVSVPPLASLNTGDTFSVEGWLKRGTTGGTANQVIASKQGTAWTLAFNTANKLVLQSNGSTIVTSTSTVADTSAWHYVAATKSGSTVHLYVDGADVTGAVTNVTLANTTSPLAIGQSGSASWFNGRLDEIALYNVALTGSQTSNHYALGQAPANTSLPTITGTAADGQTLTASNGSWSGATATYSYQWRTCDATGASCQDIAGASGPTYAIGHGDVGTTLRVVVTATNAGGSASATSAQTAAVAATAPANAALPAISGTAANGQTLTADPGSWSGTPGSFSYQWKRCDSAGANCTDITGATSRTYALATADVGATVRVAVTDTNAAGSSTATSPQTAVVVDVAPAVTANPSVTGGSTPPQEGEVLTAAQGGFSGNVTSRAFQWQSCDAQGANCADIAGATASTYTLGHGDIGTTVRVADVASNSAGSTRAYSSTRGPIVSGAPQNLALPGISGTAAENSRLTTDGGTWSGNVTSTSYQWLSCDSNGDNCVNPQPNQTSGTTSSFYDVWNWETGHRLRVRVTKTNAYGSTNATSAPTAVVTGLVPVAANPSRVTSFDGGFPPTEGQTLTAISGGWNGTVNSQHWQWQSCDSSGNNCADVQGATSNQYKIGPGEGGTEIRATEIATNAAGSARAYSAPVGPVISAKPANTVAPFITGTPTEGNRLLVNPGQWTGNWSTTSYQWKRCDSVGDNCVDITGATTTNYVVANADHGHVIRTLVTQSGAYGSTSALSTGTGAATGYPPTSTVAPTTTGGSNPPLQGDTLNAVSGGWSGTVDSRSFQWQSCDPQGANCADIAGATGASYTLGAGDNGTKVRVAEIATNTAGSTRAYSTARGPVASQQPANTAPPTITGTPTEGSQLTANDGSWSGNITSTFYEWQRCDADGTNCVNVASGATVWIYRVVNADHGHTLRVRVTKSGPYGSGSATSAPSAVVVGTPPSSASLPQLTAPQSPPMDGDVVQARAGDWNGVVNSDSFQWQSCDAQGANCADIAGATSSAYTLGFGDVGTTVRVVETATNAAGSAQAYSIAIGPVVGATPANTSLPTISGTPAEGTTLTSSDGSWSGKWDATGYTWERCDSDGANCDEIEGADTATYRVVNDDSGHTLRLSVEKSGIYGVTDATSAATAVVDGVPPSIGYAPTIGARSSDPIEGDDIWVNPGGFGGEISSRTYQWQSCDAGGANCADIAGATDTTYVLGAGDVGTTLRVAETAHNAAGAITSYSSPTRAVVSGGPIKVSDPSISGAAAEGQQLTATTGNWNAIDPLDFAFQWQGCDASGQNCADIADATDPTYTLTAGDVDHTVRVVVTASNDVGGVQAASQPTAPVAVSSPVNTALPEVTGNAVHGGGVLTASPGSWTGSKLSYSYKWLRCDGLGAGCVQIAGETGSSLTLGAGDTGMTMRVVVTAGNDAGSASATSLPSEQIDPPAPTNDTAPSVQGLTLEGQSLRADPGLWSGGIPRYSYSWQRCASTDVSSCTDTGATGEYYDLTSADVGQHLRVVVTATNSTSAATAEAAMSDPVDALPPPPDPPQIVGTPEYDQPMTAVQDPPAGLSNVSYDYSWETCDENDPENCEPVDGAAAATYKPQEEDLGQTLRADVNINVGLGPNKTTVFKRRSQPSHVVTGTTIVNGDHELGARLEIDPITRSSGKDTDELNLAGNQPLMFIQAMPKDELMRSVTIGNIGNASGQYGDIGAGGGDCTTSPPATLGLLVYKHPTGDLGEGGGGFIGNPTIEQVASAEQPKVVPDTPGKVTWRFSQPVPLEKGAAYSFVPTSQGGCQFVDVNTWVHNRAKVNGGNQFCQQMPRDIAFYPFGSGISRRIWHEKGQADIGPGAPKSTWDGCYAKWTRSFKRSMPTGWLQSVAADAGDGNKYIISVGRNDRSPKCGDSANVGAKMRSWNGPWINKDDKQVGVCTWPQFTPPFGSVADGWYYALPWTPEHKGRPRDMYMRIDPELPDAAAARFRPVLRFDSSEQWRPLAVEEMLQEGGHQIKDPGQKPVPIHGTSALWKHPVGNLDIRGKFHLSDGGADYHSPYPECTTQYRDCDSGGRSVIYFNKVDAETKDTPPRGYTYYDYWIFYRANYYLGKIDFHEADWEGVTVGVDDPNAQEFDFVGFSEHGKFYSYLPDNLQCGAGDDLPGTGTCATNGNPGSPRVNSMVANGSHANYANPCSEPFWAIARKCRSDNTFLTPFDRGYDGAKKWGNTNDPYSLLPLPNWGAWGGTWGVHMSFPATGEIPSPLLQGGSQGVKVGGCSNLAGNLGLCPGLPGRKRRVVRRRSEAAPTRVQRRVSGGLAPIRLARRFAGKSPAPDVATCGNWLGGGVAAVVCDPKTLRQAIATRTLGEHAGTTLGLRSAISAASARGVTQVMGSSVDDGQRVALRGRAPKRAQILLRVDDKASGAKALVQFRVGDVFARGNGTGVARVHAHTTRGGRLVVKLHGRSPRRMTVLKAPRQSPGNVRKHHH